MRLPPGVPQLREHPATLGMDRIGDGPPSRDLLVGIEPWSQPVSASIDPAYWQDPSHLTSTPAGWVQPSPHRALETAEIAGIVAEMLSYHCSERLLLSLSIAMQQRFSDRFAVPEDDRANG